MLKVTHSGSIKLTTKRVHESFDQNFARPYSSLLRISSYGKYLADKTYKNKGKPYLVCNRKSAHSLTFLNELPVWGHYLWNNAGSEKVSRCFIAKKSSSLPDLPQMSNLFYTSDQKKELKSIIDWKNIKKPHENTQRNCHLFHLTQGAVCKKYKIKIITNKWNCQYVTQWCNYDPQITDLIVFINQTKPNARHFSEIFRNKPFVT